MQKTATFKWSTFGINNHIIIYRRLLCAASWIRDITSFHYFSALIIISNNTLMHITYHKEVDDNEHFTENVLKYSFDFCNGRRFNKTYTSY